MQVCPYPLLSTCADCKEPTPLQGLPAQSTVTCQRRRRSFLAVVTLGVLLGLLRAGWADPAITEKELAAYLSYDLGPDTVDVSRYPTRQQENYQVFRQTCSQCHTPARALNAPLTTRDEWTRFVQRMRGRMHPGGSLTREGRDRIVDFLVYDSQVRKIEGKAAFDQMQRQLRQRFDEVQKERARRAKQPQKMKEPVPYTGTR